MAATIKHVSAEAVTPGHPDKIADQIADAVVDAMLAQDPMGRCGCEVLVNAHFVVVSGEFKTRAELDVPHIVKRTLREIGYTDPRLGFTAEECAVIASQRQQSPEISEVIDKSKGMSAADQGVMYGYACNETPEFMPLPVQLARKLVYRLDDVRHSGELPYLRPDGKAQVTIAYGREGQPPRVASLVVAAQHDPEVDIETIRGDVLAHIIRPAMPQALLDANTKIIINKLGRFIQGGPAIDTGVTGRKLVADTYGGIGRTGGGALSGKDPTKLDRTGAYYGRYIAKSLVAAGLAQVCQVELAYAFGEMDPVGTSIETFGTGTVPDEELLDVVRSHFRFRPAEMIEELDLRRPIYLPTAAYGHFGRADYPWERIAAIR